MVEKISTQDPFYEDKLAELTDGLDLDQASEDFSEASATEISGLGIQFETTPIPGNQPTPDLRLESAIDSSAGDLHKHIYHILDCSPAAAEGIGEKLQSYCVDVLHPIATDVCCQFSANPLLRGTWDFLVWGVPQLRSRDVHRLGIEAITGTFGGQ